VIQVDKKCTDSCCSMIEAPATHHGSFFDPGQQQKKQGSCFACID
jgi:hypothetical protein